MSRLLGKLSLGLHESAKSDTFTYPLYTEIYSATGISTLQVGSAPASGPVGFTVSAANSVSCSNSASTMVQTPTIYAMGKNNSASAAVVSYRAYVNGSAVTTSGTISVTAGNYFCVNYYSFFNAVAGDYLEIRLWADKTPCILILAAFMPNMTRYMPMGKAGRLITNATFTPQVSTPGFSAVTVGNLAGTVYLVSDDNYVEGNHLMLWVNGESYSYKAKVVSTLNSWIMRYGDTTSTAESYQSSSLSSCYARTPPRITAPFVYVPTDRFIL